MQRSSVLTPGPTANRPFGRPPPAAAPRRRCADSTPASSSSAAAAGWASCPSACSVPNSASATSSGTCSRAASSAGPKASRKEAPALAHNSRIAPIPSLSVVRSDETADARRGATPRARAPAAHAAFRVLGGARRSCRTSAAWGHRERYCGIIAYPPVSQPRLFRCHPREPCRARGLDDRSGSATLAAHAPCNADGALKRRGGGHGV
jgi:hypothetical protein